MRLALELAAKGEGFVEPNPMVGCVIAKGNRIVGEGFHRRFGGPHAERSALQSAGPRARGATVYVTLEPCNHIGKTPPCTEALIRAGVKRVVAAMRDPNPLVAGRGLRTLRKAGIKVEVGLLRAAATRVALPFLTYHRWRRPYVLLKWAQSIDGKIATRMGDSKWITSRQSRKAAHLLRSRVDAILVGVETVLADDPLLTARMARPRRVATRVVLDNNLRIPLAAKLVRTARDAPVLIVSRSGSATDERAGARKRRRLERAGCEVIEAKADRRGIRLRALLEHLHGRQMTNLLVEGGGRVLGSFVREGLADEAYVFVAPELIGGRTAPGPLEHRGPARMSELIGVKVRKTVPYGPDLCYNIEFLGGR